MISGSTMARWSLMRDWAAARAAGSACSRQPLTITSISLARRSKIGRYRSLIAAIRPAAGFGALGVLFTLATCEGVLDGRVSDDVISGAFMAAAFVGLGSLCWRTTVFLESSWLESAGPGESRFPWDRWGVEGETRTSQARAYHLVTSRLARWETRASC